MGYEQAITSKLEKASDLMYARDLGIIDELWSDGFRLVGSEEGEIAATRYDLEGLINFLFSAPFRLRWKWASLDFVTENDIAWVFAQGQVEFVFDDHTDALPYRLVAIFKQDKTDWIWRLYSGSEPIKRRTW
jgi:hypothetical protein